MWSNLMRYPEDDEADLEAHETPEPDADEEVDRDETVSCPYCGAPVYEDAERCPICENYLSKEEVGSPRPWWFVLVVILCLLMAVSWIILG